MNRVIIADKTQAQPQPSQPTPVAAAPAQQPAQSDARDALAGALPDWDLLPATPFLRRVK